MARTAPAPNVPPTPGMCPHVVVLAGGAAGGGSGGGGAGSGGAGSGGGGSGGGAGAGDGGPGAGAGSPDGNTYKPCGTKSCPIDVGTGRMYTLPEQELFLPGPLPLVFERRYSSFVHRRDFGLGWGWAHSWGWEVDSRPGGLRVYTDTGTWEDYPRLKVGEAVQKKWGWILRRESHGYILDTGEGLLFTMSEQQGSRFRLTAIDDRNGNRILLQYQDGALTQVTDSVGRVVKVTATPEGRIGALSVRNAETRGQWVRFLRADYNDRGELEAATDADGFSNRYVYDDRGRHFLVENGYKTGLVFYFRYFRKKRCVESYGAYPGQADPSLAPGLPTTLADGQTPQRGVHHVLIEYLPDGLRQVSDSTRVESYQCNEHGLLDKAVIGGAVTTATFRDDGWVMSETDQLKATTTYERDVRGRLLSVEDPLGRVTRYQRDGNGLPIKVVDAEGGETVIDRDPKGNVTVVRDAAGAITSYQRDAKGLVTAIVDARGHTTRVHYDGHANITAIELPNGGTWHYAYDGFGRLVARTDPLGAVTRLHHSDRGDMVGETDALGHVTRYQYDGDGYLTQIVNPMGAVTKLQWGGLRKLCSRTDANGHTVHLRYNHEGELLQVENEAGELHHLDRDLNGLLIGERTFDQRHLKYRNDLAGRTVAVENGAHERTELTYDAAGQLLERLLDDGTSETFAYNLRGELTEATNAAGTYRFERDPLGRIVREEQQHAGRTDWVTSELDPEGDRVRRTTSLGHEEQVQRDALGARTHTLLDGDHDVTHVNDLLGRETARLLPGGGRLETGYDALGRVARRRSLDRTASPTVPQGQPDWVGEIPTGVTSDTQYRYRPDGELIEKLDQARGTTTYDYDPVGQLLAFVPQQAKTELFRWDPRGNLTEADPGAPARVYGVGNRLLRKGATSYRWDGDGRLVEKRTSLDDGGEEVWQYRWNAAGLLREVERPDGKLVRFAYDPFARRLHKEILQPVSGGDYQPTSATRFVWDGDVIAQEICVGASSVAGDPVVEERTYVFADASFEPVAFARSDAEWTHCANDQIGTPAFYLDETGATVGLVGGTAWGADGAGKQTSDVAHAGQWRDREVNLNYNRYRYYDPDTARFLSPDPVGLLAGTNQYFIAPNLASWIDPLGLTNKNGLIYLRTNKKTGEEYVGQAKPGRYMARQCDHRRDHPDADFEFDVLEEVDPDSGRSLDVAEEDWIRAGGGPRKQGGPLANARYQMNDDDYKAAGGNVPKPPKKKKKT